MAGGGLPIRDGNGHIPLMASDVFFTF